MDVSIQQEEAPVLCFDLPGVHMTTLLFSELGTGLSAPFGHDPFGRHFSKVVVCVVKIPRKTGCYLCHRVLARSDMFKKAFLLNDETNPGGLAPGNYYHSLPPARDMKLRFLVEHIHL